MKQRISGKEFMAYSKLERVPVGDVDGHLINLLVGEGINFNTGKEPFMDHAQVSVYTTSDVIHFNGPFVAYSIITRKGETVYSKAEGKVTANMTPEGTPVVLIEGTVNFYKGTGQFENIRGEGTFKGQYLSTIMYSLEWEGEYWIEK